MRGIASSGLVRAALAAALWLGLAALWLGLAAPAVAERSQYQDDVRPPTAGGAATPAQPVAKPKLDADVPVTVTPRRTRSEMWRGIRRGEAGRTLIPDQRATVLIRVEAQGWRERITGSIKVLGAWLLFLVVLAIVTLYVVRGKEQVRGRATKRLLLRFSGLQRFAHWLTALSFLALGLTGLNLTYGKQVLMPLTGPDGFARLAGLGKSIHVYVASAFVLGLLLMLALWLPGGRSPGGAGSRRSAGKYNRVQRLGLLVFTVGGLLIAASGAALVFPYTVLDVAGMRSIQFAHTIFALLLLAAALVHFYIGALQKEGALGAIISGRVSEAWARQYHKGWYDSFAEDDADAPPSMPAAPKSAEPQPAAKPAAKSKPEVKPKPAAKSKPEVKPKPAAISKPVEKSKPAAKPKPVEKPKKPAAVSKPVEKSKPAAKSKPVEKPKPAAKSKPAAKPKPAPKPEAGPARRKKAGK